MLLKNSQPISGTDKAKGRRQKAKVECSEMAQKAPAEGRRQKAEVKS